MPSHVHRLLLSVRTIVVPNLAPHLLTGARRTAIRPKQIVTLLLTHAVSTVIRGALSEGEWPAALGTHGVLLNKRPLRIELVSDMASSHSMDRAESMSIIETTRGNNGASLSIEILQIEYGANMMSIETWIGLSRERDGSQVLV